MIDHIIALVESRLELAKIETKKEAAFIVARILLGIVFGLFLFFVWLFLSLGLGYLINEAIGNTYSGILIIAGVHLLLFILLFIFRGQLGLEKLIKKGIDKLFE
jgi:uncharacterized membrane protein YqjE